MTGSMNFDQQDDTAKYCEKSGASFGSALSLFTGFFNKLLFTGAFLLLRFYLFKLSGIP
jgi:hypothetical protein